MVPRNREGRVVVEIGRAERQRPDERRAVTPGRGDRRNNGSGGCIAGDARIGRVKAQCQIRCRSSGPFVAPLVRPYSRPGIQRWVGARRSIVSLSIDGRAGLISGSRLCERCAGVVARLAGRVCVAPVVGSTHGHALVPKKAGFEARYIEFGMANPPGVLCQRCEFVSKS